MILRLLRSVWSRATAQSPETVAELPRDKQYRLASAHHRAPRDTHLRIMFDDMRVGAEPLMAFTDACALDSDSLVPPLKALHRPLASYFLARYFLYSLDLTGARAECGVFNGMSALVMCRAAKTRVADYDGANLHLIDSFQGLSRPGPEDHVQVQAAAAGAGGGSAYAEGALATSIHAVQEALRDFPRVAIHTGWIPEAFGELPDTKWAFVHLDVDLYAPTLASLEYFYPRLTQGGVIVCDDYSAPLFPGAHRAWDEFCAEHDLPYVVLDTGQSVIIKP